MFDQITKEIKSQLYDRARSPLFGTFAISWIFWNYKLVIAIVFSESVEERFSYIDKYVEVSGYITGCGLLYPVISAFAFIFLYPFPARFVFWYWSRQHVKLKKVQQEIEDEMPITREEANTIRRSAIEQQAQFQLKLKELSELNNSLSTQLDISSGKILSLTSENFELKASLERKEDEIALSKSSFKSIDEIKGEKNKSKKYEDFNKEVFMDFLHSENDSVRHVLTERITSNKSIQNVFLVLVALGGEAFSSEIESILGANVIEIKHALERLSSMNLVSSTQDKWTLSHKGKGIAVEGGLTVNVPIIKRNVPF